MKKIHLERILAAIIFISVSTYPFAGDAAVTTLPWSCNYDSCPDWTYGQSLNCCGLSPGGPWACNNTGYEQINSTTGLGGSGKAQIHWVGAGDDNQAGGLEVEFAPSAYSRELYVRFYIKYEPGYEANATYSKDLYIDLGVWGMTVVLGFSFDDGYMLTGGTNAICSSGCGWNSIFSDNQWHWIEVHMKYGNGDGIKECWIDGRQIFSVHNASFGQASYTFRRIRIGSNQGFPTHSGCKYRAYDNIAISTTGPIGPAGGPPPAPPLGITAD